jgi:hypothetical protein
MRKRKKEEGRRRIRNPRRRHRENVAESAIIHEPGRDNFCVGGGWIIRLHAAWRIGRVATLLLVDARG